MPVVVPLIALGAAYLAVRSAKSQSPEPEPSPPEPGPEQPNDEEPEMTKVIPLSAWGEGWTWPVPGDAIVSQEFKPGVHLGVDIMFRDGEHYYAPQGTAILAAKSGTVWSTGTGARGMNVVLDHGPPFATFYQHLERVDVIKGQYVEAGEQIGIMGIDPTDKQRVRHLHFAVWYQGNGDKASVDPGPVIDQWERV